jgi:hypothetical protein
MIGYSNHSQTGWLPANIKVVAGYFGGTYPRHPARVHRLLNQLADLGWLDKHVDSSNMSIRYEIHHWEDWQSSKFDVFEPKNLLPSGALKTIICSQGAPKVLPMGANVVANNDVTALLKSKSKKKIKNTTSLRSVGLFDQDDFEDGINNAGTKVIEPSLYNSLLDTMESSWISERKIPLKSISDKSDYIALHSMVARVAPEGFTLSCLQASWARFLVSTDRYHRSQSHPIRFFANNLGSFLEDAKPVQAKWTENKADRAAREVHAFMLELERTKP